MTLCAFALGEAADRAWWLLRTRLASEHRGPNVFELYVVGESTAEGIPYNPRAGFPQIVSLLFDGRIRGRRIEIINIARAGSTLYPQTMAFERRVRYRDRETPGAVLVYSGHNDNGMWNQTSRGRISTWSGDIFRRSWLLSDFLLYSERAGIFAGPRSLTTYSNNLVRTVDAAREAGLIPILSTVIGNVTDMEPWLRKPSEATWEEIRKILAKGDLLEEAGKISDAQAYYASIGERIPEMSSYMDYRRARCYHRLGNYEAAYALYWKVSDDGDSGYGRATRLQNNFVRDVARNRSAFLVDAVKIFESRSAHRLVGTEWFEDGQHPNLQGYLLLAQGYARALSVAVNEPLRRADVSMESLPRLLSLGSAEMISSHLTSARWLLAVSREHPSPRHRLALARKHFEAVLALAPDNLSGWLGLGVIEAAGTGNLLMDKRELAWLDRYRLIIYGQEYSIRETDRREIARHFKRLGVSARILRHIERK